MLGNLPNMKRQGQSGKEEKYIIRLYFYSICAFLFNFKGIFFSLKLSMPTLSIVGIIETVFNE